MEISNKLKEIKITNGDQKLLIESHSNKLRDIVVIFYEQDKTIVRKRPDGAIIFTKQRIEKIIKKK